MSKSKLRNLIVLAIATSCLIVASLPSQAANKTEKDQPGKGRLVLMPLQAGENEMNLLAQMETALVHGLAQQYEVISGKRVIQSLQKASERNRHAARKKGCDETGCLKHVARDLHAEIFATVHVTKIEGGFLLSLDIRNIMTSQAIFDISLPCKGCNQSQVLDKLEELSNAPAAMSAQAFTPGVVFRDCDYCPDMVVIPAGSFDMGSASSEEQDEKPEHRVTITQSFAIGKVEITRGQFAAFVNAASYDTGGKCWTLAGDEWGEFSGSWRNPGYPQEDSHPVACINWNDAQAYVKWLSFQTGKQYQLPTESQWEYACRAGEQIEYCGSNDVDSVAWYDHNSGKTTHPATTRQPNAFGLYDMSGNVGEWIEDSYHKRYNGAPSDGSAWSGDSSKRMLRGGSWLYYKKGARSAFRSVSSPGYRYFDSGFRVVRMLP